MNIKRVVRLVIFMLSLLTVIALAVSCADPEPCLNHIDTDSDNICDICGTDVTPPLPEPDEHRDENRDFICDECGTECFPDCGGEHKNENDNNKCDICGKDVPVDITVSVVDHLGNPIANVKVSLEDENFNKYEGTTNNDGKIVLSLLVGRYDISYDLSELDANYITGATSVTLSDEDREINLEFVDNTPNGTFERPFVISTDETSVSLTIPANTKYEYKIPFGGGRTVTFYSPDIEVLYHERAEDGSYSSAQYLPDSKGEISFKLRETDTNTPNLFSVENKSGQSITFNVSLVSRLGSLSNPIVIDSIEGPVSCELAAETTVNYKWVATDGKWLKVVAQPIYVFRKDSTSAAPLVKTEGGECLVGTYTATLESGLVTVIITETEIEVVDETTDWENVSGSYSYTLEGGVITILSSADGVAVDTFSLAACQLSVYITNSRTSAQKVIGDGINEALISVSEGDEIRFSITSAYDVELILNLALLDTLE